MGYLDEYGNPTNYDADKLSRGHLYQTQDTLPRSDGMPNAPVWGDSPGPTYSGAQSTSGLSSGCGLSLKTIVWLTANYLIYLFGFCVYQMNTWLMPNKYYIIAGYMILIFITVTDRSSTIKAYNVLSLISFVLLYPAAFIISYTLVFLLAPEVTPDKITFWGMVIVNLLTYAGERILTYFSGFLAPVIFTRIVHYFK